MALSMTQTANEGNFNTPAAGSLLAPKPLSLTPTAIPASVTAGIKVNTPTVQVPVPGISGATQTAPNALFTTPVSTTPSATAVHAANPIALPNPTASANNLNTSLRATSDAAMATSPANTPPPAYDATTGFLTPYGKSQGMKPVQPNDPAGGSNSSSLVNSYLSGNTAPSGTPNGMTSAANNVNQQYNPNNPASTNTNQNNTTNGNTANTNSSGTNTINPSNINNGNLIPDTSGNTNNSYLSQYNSLNNQLGTETDVRNQLNTQYGVDDAQNNYIKAFNAYNTKSAAYNQQIESMYHQAGTGAAGVGAEVTEQQRINNADLANSAIAATSAQGLYTTALDIVQRKMDAQFQPVQAQIDNLKAITQSPNSDLTASQTAQINANMFALQNNMTNTKNALSTGSQTLIQNGLYTADIGKQLDSAQTPEQVNAIVSQAMTGAGLADPNAAGNASTGGLAGVNPQYQSYVATTQSGAQYVPQDKLANLTPFQQQEAGRQLAAANIPVLTTDQTQKMQNIDVTQQNLIGLSNVISGKDVTTGAQGAPLLGSGVAGRIGSSVTNFLGNLTQSNPNIAAFNNYRLTAINTLQSLGAGAGGSRITASEIATAVSNLPTLTDNMETAQAKLSIVNGFLTKWTNELVPNSTKNNSTTSSGTATGGWGSLGD